MVGSTFIFEADTIDEWARFALHDSMANEGYRVKALIQSDIYFTAGVVRVPSLEK